MSAAVEPEAVEILGCRAAAQVRRLLDNGHIYLLTCQVAGGGQAGHPASDHDNVRLRESCLHFMVLLPDRHQLLLPSRRNSLLRARHVAEMVCSSAGSAGSRRHDSADSVQLLGVGHDIDGPDDPVGHTEYEHRDGLTFGDEQNARLAVYRRHADAQVSYDRLASDGPQESGQPLLGRDSEQEAGHLLCPPNRAARRERTSTAVGYERYFGREDCHECFQISGGGCFEEALGHSALLGLIGVEARSAFLDVVAGAAAELTNCIILAAEDISDFGIRHPEGLPQHKYRP